MLVEFERAAEEELGQAIEYYEAQGGGLGLDFLHEVEQALRRIGDFPHTWPSVSRRSRRCRLQRFPYGLIYQVHEGRAAVIAVMHMHRRPGY